MRRVVKPAKSTLMTEGSISRCMIAFAIPLMMFSQVGCAALRATENVRVPLVAAILGVVINTSLNYCLIGGHFGFPALGVKGAAIATVAGAGTQALVALAAILFGKNPIRAPIGEYFTFNR